MATGFEIYGRFYEAVESFNLGDPILIRELTGMDFPDFAAAYDALISDVAQAGEAEADPAVMIGLVGVAVWRGNPTWRRDKVVKFVQHLPMDALNLIGDEEDEEQDPPAPAPEDSRSGGTQNDSSSLEGADPNRNGSGDPTSAVGAESGSPT